jgi:hypothetical protein
MEYIPILEHIPQTTYGSSFQNESEEDLSNLEEIHFCDLQHMSFQRGLIDPPRESVPLTPTPILSVTQIFLIFQPPRSAAAKWHMSSNNVTVPTLLTTKYSISTASLCCQQ